MIAILTYVLLAIVAVLCLVTAYLLVMIGASLLARRKPGLMTEPTKKFAVLIPAYNEGVLVGRVLDSLCGLSYPKFLYDLFVVADNCTDNTAFVAQQHGATVYERYDLSQRGKGYAIQWLLGKVFTLGRDYDAFVIFDADSEVSTNFLDVMNTKLCEGSKVIQGYYNVLNPSESWGASLRNVALALIHYIRPLAKGVLGVSCGLKGNGMCFATCVLEQYDWSAFTLAEDVEFHLKLVSAGLKVDFAPEAMVLAQMPSSLKSARSQNLRWERGRIEMARQYALKLLVDGLRDRSLTKIDAAVEQLIPPISVPFALAVICLVASLLLGEPLLITLSGVVIIGHLLYVFGGLLIAHVPIRTYISLLYAPVYVMWKFWLYLSVLFALRRYEWIRTRRTG